MRCLGDRKWFVCGVFLGLFAGCTVMPTDPRQVNAEHIGRLEPGMTRQEVDSIMGTGPWVSRESIYTDERLVGYLDLDVANPYRTETRERENDRYVVLYYYAMPGGMDMTFWDTQYDERTVPDFFLTPVVLKNDKVVGVGMDAMVREGLGTPLTGVNQEASMLKGR